MTKPKPREIFAADFRDRIVHHVLVGYLEPIFDKKFIDQSYACRKRKGAHKAIDDLERYIRKATKGNVKEVYYLQLDIQSFFVSLKKDVLFEQLKRHIKNPDILWLAKTIIFYNPTRNYYRKSQMSLFDLIPDHKSLFKVSPDQGLPIGNLTSQFFANVYLDEFDQFIKHTLKIKYYLRYVDDFIILSDDKDQLIKWRKEIGNFLEEKLKLKLHPKKQVIQTVDKGINFVGYIVKPSHILVRRRVVKSLKSRLLQFNNTQEEIPKEEMGKVLSVVNSYYGQFKHANTFGLRSKLWQENFGKLQRFLKPVDTSFSHFNIKNFFRLRQKSRDMI